MLSDAGMASLKVEKLSSSSALYSKMNCWGGNPPWYPGCHITFREREVLLERTTAPSGTWGGPCSMRLTGNMTDCGCPATLLLTTHWYWPKCCNLTTGMVSSWASGTTPSGRAPPLKVHWYFGSGLAQMSHLRTLNLSPGAAVTSWALLSFHTAESSDTESHHQ
ncbi:hypothetical protein NP493_758g01006 [Ridgeia piscesae]|uniref:Uncharacterized protein n=1 Tax=Ridgeia piscesae TaxID=27915 RepID=A0AAD9NNN4_RIDPI|nr:hypothetical protein NP493_758g01006 [Ridgeia piscesae]